MWKVLQVCHMELARDCLLRLIGTELVYNGQQSGSVRGAWSVWLSLSAGLLVSTSSHTSNVMYPWRTLLCIHSTRRTVALLWSRFGGTASGETIKESRRHEMQELDCTADTAESLLPRRYKVGGCSLTSAVVALPVCEMTVNSQINRA